MLPKNGIKGNGDTLSYKLNVLYDTWKLKDIIWEPYYYNNFIEYGMAKYILCRLLYGYFNINFLYRKYNKQFFTDLKNSRFCVFVNYFKDPKFVEYDTFFKYDSK